MPVAEPILLDYEPEFVELPAIKPKTATTATLDEAGVAIPPPPDREQPPPADRPAKAEILDYEPDLLEPAEAPTRPEPSLTEITPDNAVDRDRDDIEATMEQRGELLGLPPAITPEEEVIVAEAIRQPPTTMAALMAEPPGAVLRAPRTPEEERLELAEAEAGGLGLEALARRHAAAGGLVMNFLTKPFLGIFGRTLAGKGLRNIANLAELSLHPERYRSVLTGERTAPTPAEINTAALNLGLYSSNIPILNVLAQDLPGFILGGDAIMATVPWIGLPLLNLTHQLMDNDFALQQGQDVQWDLKGLGESAAMGLVFMTPLPKFLSQAEGGAIRRAAQTFGGAGLRALQMTAVQAGAGEKPTSEDFLSHFALFAGMAFPQAIIQVPAGRTVSKLVENGVARKTANEWVNNAVKGDVESLNLVERFTQSGELKKGMEDAIKFRNDWRERTKTAEAAETARQKDLARRALKGDKSAQEELRQARGITAERKAEQEAIEARRAEGLLPVTAAEVDLAASRPKEIVFPAEPVEPKVPAVITETRPDADQVAIRETKTDAQVVLDRLASLPLPQGVSEAQRGEVQVALTKFAESGEPVTPEAIGNLVRSVLAPPPEPPVRPKEAERAIPVARSEQAVGRRLLHFTLPERAEALRKERKFAFGNKPLFGTGGLRPEEKTGRFAGERIYLSLDDTTWSALNEFTPSGKAVVSTGGEEAKTGKFFYDYDKQQWMYQPGKWKKSPLEGVEVEIAPTARILLLDSIASSRAAFGKYGVGLGEEFWQNAAKDYDAIEIRNTKTLSDKSKFFRYAYGDQLIVLNPEVATITGEARGLEAAPTLPPPAPPQPTIEGVRPTISTEAAVGAIPIKPRRKKKQRIAGLREKVAVMLGQEMTINEFVVMQGGIRPHKGKFLSEELYGVKGKGGPIDISLRARTGHGEYADVMADMAVDAGLLKVEPHQTPEMALLEALATRPTREKVAAAEQAEKGRLEEEIEEVRAARRKRAAELYELRQRMKTGERIQADDVVVGDSFTIDGEKFTVEEELDQGLLVRDKEEIVIPYETPAEKTNWLYIDKGSLKHAEPETGAKAAATELDELIAERELLPTEVREGAPAELFGEIKPAKSAFRVRLEAIAESKVGEARPELLHLIGREVQNRAAALIKDLDAGSLTEADAKERFANTEAWAERALARAHRERQKAEPKAVAGEMFKPEEPEIQGTLFDAGKITEFAKSQGVTDEKEASNLSSETMQLTLPGLDAPYLRKAEPPSKPTSADVQELQRYALTHPKDPDALKRALEATGGRISNLIPALINRDIPGFNVVGRVIKTARDFATMALAARSRLFEVYKIAVASAKTGKVLYSSVTSVGVKDSTTVDPQAFIQAAQFASKKSGIPISELRVFGAHNHPSGMPLPSPADKAVIRSINEAAKDAGVTVDHFITDGDKYYDLQLGQTLRFSRLRKLPIDVVPPERLQMIGGPWDLAPIADALRQGNPDAIYVIAVDGKNAIRQIEQYSRQQPEAELLREISVSLAQIHAGNVFVILPKRFEQAKSLATSLAQMVTRQDVSLLDINSPDVPSWRERGLFDLKNREAPIRELTTLKETPEEYKANNQRAVEAAARLVAGFARKENLSVSPELVKQLLDQKYGEKLQPLYGSIIREAGAMLRGETLWEPQAQELAPAADIRARQEAAEALTKALLGPTEALPGAEADRNRNLAEDNKRNGETERPVTESVSIPPDNPNRIAMDNYEANLDEAYKQNKVWNPSLNDMLILDAPDAIGKVELVAGEPGVFDSVRRVEKGRHVQEKEHIEFLETLEKFDGSSWSDLWTISAEQQEIVQTYLDTGKGWSRIDPHWQKVIVGIRDWMQAPGHTEAQIKYLRTARYAVRGKTGKREWSKAQHAALKPLRDLYLKVVKNGTVELSVNEYTVARDKFLQSKDANVLLVGENYFPHRSPKPNGVDDVVLFGKSLIKDFKDGSPPPRRSETALKLREDPRSVDEITGDNPLIRLVNHVVRTQINFYLSEPLQDLHSKLISGQYLDGRWANRRSAESGVGTPIVSQYAQELLAHWYQNVMGMRPPPNVWELAIYRARANLWKTIAAKTMVLQPFQRFFGGINDPRYVKLFEALPLDKMRMHIEREIQAMFPRDAKRIMNSLDQSVLLGKQIEREYAATDKESHLNRLEDGWRWFVLKPIQALTDNAIINGLNRLPLIGGDQHSKWVANLDGATRAATWIEWMRKGKSIIIDNDVTAYRDLIIPLQLNQMEPFERYYFARLMANGQLVDAIMFNAETQTRRGNYRYDAKLSSFMEQLPLARHLLQYSKFWRGVTAAAELGWKALTRKDWLSKSRARQQVGAVKTIVTVGSLTALSGLFVRYFTGRWDPKEDDESLALNFARNFWNQFKLGPYQSSGVGGPNDIATPLWMLNNVIGERKLPMQIGESLSNLAKLAFLGTKDLVTAYLWRTEAYHTGDRELLEKSNALMNDNLARTMERGEQYMKEYYALGQWLFSILDHSETLNRQGFTTRSANWFRVAYERAATKLGIVPDWLEEYDPELMEYSLWEKITQTIFRTKRPPAEEKPEEKPVVPFGHLPGGE